jgi:hypothetical protein
VLEADPLPWVPLRVVEHVSSIMSLEVSRRVCLPWHSEHTTDHQTTLTHLSIFANINHLPSFFTSIFAPSALLLLQSPFSVWASLDWLLPSSTHYLFLPDIYSLHTNHLLSPSGGRSPADWNAFGRRTHLPLRHHDRWHHRYRVRKACWGGAEGVGCGA